MTILNFFTIHTETEEDWVSTDIELNFACSDHVTVIECEGVADNTDLSGLMDCLRSLFEGETACTYEIKQYLGSFTHKVSVYGDQEAPSFAFICDRIKVTECDV